MSGASPESEPAWRVHLPAGVALAEVDLAEGGNLPACWTRRWSQAPAQPVLHDDHRGWLTAEEVEARTRRVASRLAAAGLSPGDRLLVSAAPSVDLVIAYVAALRLGLTVVPANTGYRGREVAHIVGDCRPAGALVDDRERGEWVRTASTAPLVVVGPEVDLPDGVEVPVLDRVAPTAPALIAYTSGTTGAPKGAVLSHANLLASAHALRLAWRWTPDDRLVLALPLFHLHGLGVGLNGSLTSGAAVLVRPRFDVDDVLDAAAELDGTMFFGVPTMYGRLAASSRLGELARLRLCVSGSAPLPPDLWHAVADGGRQEILERYGMTETVMTVSNPHDGERRPGTVGFPLPGVDVRISAEDGQLHVRGPNVFGGYWERPEATAEAFDDEGWFATGDVVDRDADGYLRILGRTKELIISGGYNVYPREVEEVLRDHPAVADVAVVGLPSDEWGEQVTAFVVPDGPLDDRDVLAFAAERLAAYKCPKELRRVDALPRNAMGKVLKHELR